MRLMIKQRFFSWFDSFDVYDESGAAAFSVKGQLAWGHCLQVYNAAGMNVGTVKEKLLRFLPTFELYNGGGYIGDIKKEFTFLTPKYTVNYGGWAVQGDLMGWDYSVYDAYGNGVMRITKEVFNWTNTYVIDIANPANIVVGLMVVLAIDAANCSQN